MMAIVAALAQSLDNNPEAMIRAAVAASDAATSAYWAAMLSIVTLVVLLIGGAMMLYMAFEFKSLVKNTNGMREKLVEATRKLALIQGNIAGRAELKEEEAGLKRPMPPGTTSESIGSTTTTTSSVITESTGLKKEK